jgi:hypothetical protein
MKPALFTIAVLVFCVILFFAILIAIALMIIGMADDEGEI